MKRLECPVCQARVTDVADKYEINYTSPNESADIATICWKCRNEVNIIVENSKKIIFAFISLKLTVNKK